MANPKLRSAIATIGGVLFALIAAEIAMRPFFFQYTGKTWMEVRQYQEGVSESHFFRAEPSAQWFRVTGNDMIMGGENVVILGDSYLAAKHIRDSSTIGALIENWSRSEGMPLNVLQCGLPGGTAATYAGVADKLLATWNPKWVIVMLNDTDLSEEALTTSVQYQLKLTSGGSPRVSRSVQPRWIRFPLELDSSLIQTIHFRCGQMAYVSQKSEQHRKISKDDEELLRILPKVSVTFLKQAYGSRLMIIFFPQLRMRTPSAPGEPELQLKKECSSEGVPFASCRNEFIKLRQSFIYVNGFHNTVPGDGHLNEKGHLVMAQIAWKLLNSVDGHTQTAQKKIIGEHK